MLIGVSRIIRSRSLHILRFTLLEESEEQLSKLWSGSGMGKRQCQDEGSIKLKAPEGTGVADEQRKAIKTGNCSSAVQARWLERGEGKSAPHIRIQGFHAGIR